MLDKTLIHEMEDTLQFCDYLWKNYIEKKKPLKIVLWDWCNSVLHVLFSVCDEL